MDRDRNQWTPQRGMDVVGADNEKVGEVDSIAADHFVVRKGFFFPEDHYIPMSAVSTYDDKGVYLNVTRDEALEQQWTTAPEGVYDPATTGSASTVGSDLDQVDTSARPRATNPAGGGYDPDLDRRDNNLEDRDSTSIPVHEEELVGTRRDVDRGDVRINKDVVEEEESLDVPVTEERVNVSRRTVDREAAPGEDAFEEGTLEVPVHGEEVDVEKRTRVTEEVDVDKTAEQHTEHVSDTVRREEVNVEGEEIDSTDDRARRK